MHSVADFAENSMTIQDAVQVWHWTKQLCTIHPVHGSLVEQ